MDVRDLIKAFISGIAFPAVFLPVAYAVLYYIQPETTQGNPLQFIPLFIPMLFGITNSVSLWIDDRYSVENREWRLWISGACLGLIVAFPGVLIFKVPVLVFGLSHGFEYLPFLILPIVYGAIFRFIVGWLNLVLDLE